MNLVTRTLIDNLKVCVVAAVRQFVEAGGVDERISARYMIGVT